MKAARLAWVLAAALVATGGGCKRNDLKFTCAGDTQCGGDGRCVDGACAFPSAICATGLAFDKSAGPRAGQCVGATTSGGDMATMQEGGDMVGAAPQDMVSTTPPDMTLEHCSWHATANLPAFAYRIYAADSSHLWAMGDKVMISNTSGAGWSTYDAGVRAGGVVGFGNTVFIAGGGIVRMDGNAVTVERPAESNRPLRAMWGPDPDHLVAMGDFALPVSRNGGVWTASTVGATQGSDIWWMHGTSATNIWAAGDSEVTRWDGQSWHSQFLDTNNAGILASIFVLDDQTVYVLQGSGSYYVSHDGGKNWSGGKTGLTSATSIFGFPGHLYATGALGSVAHSTDGGANWTMEDTGIHEQYLQHVWGRSPTEVYVVGNQSWAVCRPD